MRRRMHAISFQMHMRRRIHVSYEEEDACDFLSNAYEGGGCM